MLPTNSFAITLMFSLSFDQLSGNEKSLIEPSDFFRPFLPNELFELGDRPNGLCELFELGDRPND